jgi:MFS family permease
MSLMGDMFPHEKRALPYSIYVMIGVCGGSAAMLIGAFVLEQVSGTHFVLLSWLNDLSPWRLTLFFVGLPAVLLALVIPLIVQEPHRPQAAGSGAPPTRQIAQHLKYNRATYLGFFGVTAMVSIINFSVLAWFPTHLIRSYGLPAADAGYLFGIFGVVASLAGGLLLPFLSRRLIEHGRPDGPVRVAIGAIAISTPLLFAALLAPTAEWSIILVAIPLLCQLGLGILLAAVAPMLAPSRVRAQMVALYYLVISLIGLGIGPILVAALSDAFFSPGEGIGRSLAGVVLLFAPIQLGLLWWSRKAFGRSYQEAAEAEHIIPTS